MRHLPYLFAVLREVDKDAESEYETVQDTLCPMVLRD